MSSSSFPFCAGIPGVLFPCIAELPYADSRALLEQFLLFVEGLGSPTSPFCSEMPLNECTLHPIGVGRPCDVVRKITASTRLPGFESRQLCGLGDTIQHPSSAFPGSRP